MLSNVEKCQVYSLYRFWVIKGKGRIKLALLPIQIRVNVGKDFALGNSLFGDFRLTKNADPDNYKYSGYGIGFDARGRFLFTDGSMIGKQVITFGDIRYLVLIWAHLCILILRRKISRFLLKVQEMVYMIPRWLYKNNIL